VNANSRFLVLTVMVFAVGAQTAPTEAKGKSPELPGFTIPASNGFVVHVVGDQDGSVTMTARRDNASGGVEGVGYSVKGKVTKKTIRANFGKFGRVAVRFKPSGRVIHPRSESCNLPRGYRRYKLRLGVFRGRIRFRGEGGLTTAVASRAKAAPALPHTPACSAFPSPDGSGASLINGYHAFYGSSFYAYKATSTSPTFLEAFTAGNRHKVLAQRFVTALGGPGAFTYDAGYSVADVANLPAPFHGSAHFTKSGRNTYSTGNLSVAFPVGASARFAGPGFIAVLDPSAISIF
jgi:hypothetical protein